jgi:hypothetical protein
MIERLQRALEHIDELPTPIQEELAEQIEQYLEPFDLPKGSLAGSMPDLPDDTEEILLRWRREVPPTPPLDEQLRWLEEE